MVVVAYVSIMQAYSLDLRQRILAVVQQEKRTQKQTAARFAVSPATVSRYVQAAQQGADLAPKKPKGKPARLNEALAQRWQEHLRDHPQATLAEQQQWLAE